MSRRSLYILLLAAAAPVSLALQPTPARPAGGVPVAADSLHYLAGSTTKMEQVIGDHDWADTLISTRSRTEAAADVLGNDIGTSFSKGDSIIFLFGDTIGATQQYVPTWTRPLNPYKWSAGDPLAWSTTASPDSGLLLNFFKKNADTTLTVTPVYPSGDTLKMGTDDVPNAGIYLYGRIYLMCKTGDFSFNGSNDNDSDSTVVVRFDPVLKTFTAGRTLSLLRNGGHFITTALHELPLPLANNPTDSEVVIFGIGKYRHSDIYLSKIKKSQFESGVNNSGKNSTRYFTGIVNGVVGWSDTESLAVPVVTDNPLLEIGVGEGQNPWPQDDPTIGNLTVGYCPALSLWLMTFDGGRQATASKSQTTGIYFTYAAAPWGPWALPQQIFNATRDHALGVYMRKYDHSTGTGTGPAGPTIGNQSDNDPDTTAGALYSPGLIENFTRISADTLKIYYTVATWNPYTIVKMRSELLIRPGGTAFVGTSGSLSPEKLVVTPNPFHSGVRVSFALARPGVVDLSIFDVSGRRVVALTHAPLASGGHEFTWDGRSAAGAKQGSGLYFIQLRSGGMRLTARLVRLN